MKISVFGLGYVGTVTGACFTELGHNVIGVDVDHTKVDLINSGKSPVIEKGLTELIGRAVTSGKLGATSDATAAVRDTDISFISVGTPSMEDGTPSLTAIKAVASEIGRALIDKSTQHTVIVRSTVSPGTTDGIITDIIRTQSGRGDGKNIAIGFNPEFLREGSSIDDFWAPPLIVSGAQEETTHNVIERLYRGVESQVIRADTIVAESIKYLCNSFHALKITYANEVGSLLKSMGIDSRVAMDAFCEDTKLNISKAYLRPGFAFGGSCLPKDLRAVLSLARQNNLDTPLLENILASNNAHLDRTLQMILKHNRGIIAYLGIAFKPATDDLRESPLVILAERLLGKGYQLKIFDRYVNTARLIGSNKKFIDKEIPHLDKLMVETIEEAVSESNLIVVGSLEEDSLRALEKAYSGQHIIDLQGHSALEDLAMSKYEGVCW